MKPKSKYLLEIISYSAGLLGLILVPTILGTRACNKALNNRTITTPGYCLESSIKGVSGHTEFISYADGTYDIKNYPGWGHRLFDSELLQDTNGDGHIDIIRKHGSELKMHRLDELLVRSTDYSTNSERFDDADDQLELAIASSHCE